ncbi:MAG: anti-phage BREX system Lon protease BrxL [Oscillospiraceae bacterium]
MDEQRMTGETADKSGDLDRNCAKVFDGKVVRERPYKENPRKARMCHVYVLEFLAWSRIAVPMIRRSLRPGVANVKRHLWRKAGVRVRMRRRRSLPCLRRRGMHTVIDKITVNLNMKTDTYEAEFSNSLDIKHIPASRGLIPHKYDRLLCGGIWVHCPARI